MGTQKNRLSETVLLSTQNICSKLQVRKYLQLNVENFCLSEHVLLPGISKILAFPGLSLALALNYMGTISKEFFSHCDNLISNYRLY